MLNEIKLDLPHLTLQARLLKMHLAPYAHLAVLHEILQSKSKPYSSNTNIIFIIQPLSFIFSEL